ERRALRPGPPGAPGERQPSCEGPPAGDRARGQDEPVRTGGAVHRGGGAARRRPRGAGPGVARGQLAAHPGRDPLARGVARSGPPLRGAGGLARPGCSGATVEPGARVSSPRMTTVLVVDDEPDIVYFAQVNLELSGYEVL